MNKNIILVINGFPRSGKDTFEYILDNILLETGCNKYLIKHSTIDFAKDMAKQCGWNGNKEIRSREMLSELKKFLTEYFDKPFNDIVELIEDTKDKNCIITICSREIDEIKRIKSHCEEENVKCYSVLIKRDISEKYHKSKSDCDVENMVYDISINNNGTLLDFKTNIEITLKGII